MKYMHALIDQLDLAGRQLHGSSAAYNRFALILVDNAVELMVHHKAKSVVRWRSQFPNPKHPMISPQKRRKILGQYLDAKTSFCQEIEWITESERQFIDACHEYRNELYHVGIKHESIIPAIAWAYHDFACDLIARDHGSIGSSSDEEPPSHIVLTHTAGEGVHTHDPAKRKTWAESLKAIKPPLVTSLADVLSQDAKQVTDDLAEYLHYLLSDGNRDKLGADDYLVRIQFSEFLMKKSAEAAEKGQALQSREEYQAFVDQVSKYWKPPIRLNPITGWQKRVNKIAMATTAIDAMNIYSQLRGDMKYLEEIIIENTMALDEQIDRQIEDYRLGL